MTAGARTNTIQRRVVPSSHLTGVEGGEVTSETEVPAADESLLQHRGWPEEDLAASDPPGEGNRLTAQLDRLIRRDVFGVNAAVLLIVLAPLAFAYYARLRWSSYSFPPDSRYYVVMALRDLGWSDAHALTEQFAKAGYVAEPWTFAH